MRVRMPGALPLPVQVPHQALEQVPCCMHSQEGRLMATPFEDQHQLVTWASRCLIPQAGTSAISISARCKRQCRKMNGTTQDSYI